MADEINEAELYGDDNPGEPEPKAEAEPKEPVGDPEREPDEGKNVPTGALTAERQRRQEAEREAREARELAKRMEERWAQLQEQLKPKEEAPKIPDWEENPDAHVLGKLGQTEKELSEFRQWKQQQDQQAQYHQQVIGLQNAFHAQAREFANEHPDFMDAYNWLRQDRDAELAALGYADPQIRQAMLWDEEVRIVANMLNNRQNAAQSLYDVAKRRGFKAMQQADDGKKLDTVAEGMAKNKSLGAATGTAGERPSLAAIADMSDEEFGQYLEKNGGYRKVLGG